MLDDIKRPRPKSEEPVAPEPVVPIDDPIDLGPVPPPEIIRSPWEPDETISEELTNAVKADEPTKSAHSFWSKGWHRSKKTTIITGVVAGLLIASGIAGFLLTRQTNAGGVYISKKLPSTKPVETRVPSNLTGLLVDKAVNDRPVIGVMIENSPDARPQSGLNQAGIIYEAIAEGGITRFLALFQDTTPEYLGPVRSARPYYAQWCGSYDCVYAHVGGSPEALSLVRSSGIRDIDQFANAGGYQRVSNRYAPHNVYTSWNKLNQTAAGKGFTGSQFTAIPRKKDAPSKTPNATAISVNISSGQYNSTYAYDAKTNTYVRSQGGAPHEIVEQSGAKHGLQPKVVVAMTMAYGIAPDKHSRYNAVGTGQGTVFQDGIATPVTWSKADTKAPLTFTDAAGKPFALNTGQTWIVAVSANNLVTYK